ncbi:MAG: thioredoxin family protein [Verrucomicrobia bacterium]|nr:thioredoxin family protein [Verrucomicrobiota bacterium]
MATTPSTMARLGQNAPPFTLPDVLTRKKVSLADFSNPQALLVIFLCRHCPYVLHVKAALIQLGTDYANDLLGVVSISSNDAERYPDDAPDSLAELARELPFPLLYDETQEVAKKYHAACTPDFFLFDRTRKLVYRGQLDESRPSNRKPATGADLRAAIDAVLANRSVSENQRPSIGCNIKWKPGNEPAYF